MVPYMFTWVSRGFHVGFTQVRHRFSHGGHGDWSTGRASAHGGVSHWVVRGVHGVAKVESQVRRAIYGHIIIWICSKCSSDFKWKWIVCCRSQMIQMVNSCWFKAFWVEMEWPQSHGKRIYHKWICLGRPFRGDGADNSHVNHVCHLCHSMPSMLTPGAPTRRTAHQVHQD